MKKLSIILISISTLWSLSAQADLLVNWENDGVAGTATSATADTIHADLSTSTLTISGSSGAAGYPDSLSAFHNNAGINSLTTAISSGYYFGFTITPAAGKSASYSDLFLRHTSQANTQPAVLEFSLLSSLTGFTSSDAIDTISASASASGANNGSGSFDITGEAALQNVAAGTAVEFRLYAHNTGANPMTRIAIGRSFGTNGTDDLTLNGSIVNAVPEPGSSILFGFGGIALLWLRKSSRA